MASASGRMIVGSKASADSVQEFVADLLVRLLAFSDAGMPAEASGEGWRRG